MAHSDPKPFSFANLRAGGSIYLLGTLLLMFVLIPLLESFDPLELMLGHRSERAGHLILKMAVAAVLVTAAVTVAHSKHPVRLIVALTAFPLVVELPTVLGVKLPSGLHAASQGYLGIALLYVVFCGVRALFGRRTVTADMIALALCAYLLAGLAWSYLYEALYLLDPESAFNGLPADASDERQQSGLFYFSFVTLTTLGYGDISPNSPVARSLVIVQAVVGQMFVAVVLARLVALQIADVAITDDDESTDG